MPRIMIDYSHSLRLKPRWNHAPCPDSNPIGQCFFLRSFLLRANMAQQIADKYLAIREFDRDVETGVFIRRSKSE
jgi:hypothetical protein